jgi:hypothetical protein
MKASKLLAMLLVSALPLAVGCKTQEQAEVDDADDTATMTTEQEIAGTNQPGDLNPVEAQTMIDDVTIGKAVGADGMIATADQGDDFAPGETVNIVMNVTDTPAGSAVKVVWFGPGETRINEEEKQVVAGNQYLNFQAADTASWQKGDYRAEVWVGDEKVNTQQFQIVDAANAGR